MDTNSDTSTDTSSAADDTIGHPITNLLNAAAERESQAQARVAAAETELAAAQANEASAEADLTAAQASAAPAPAEADPIAAADPAPAAPAAPASDAPILQDLGFADLIHDAPPQAKVFLEAMHDRAMASLVQLDRIETATAQLLELVRALSQTPAA